MVGAGRAGAGGDGDQWLCPICLWVDIAGNAVGFGVELCPSRVAQYGQCAGLYRGRCGDDAHDRALFGDISILFWIDHHQPGAAGDPMVAGIKIYKSNHLKDVAKAEASLDQDDDLSSNDVFGGSGTGYNGNLSALDIIGGHPSAIGTVKLLDLATESDYKVELQGSLFVAKYAMGHGVLRPEAAFQIEV